MDGALQEISKNEMAMYKECQGWLKLNPKGGDMKFDHKTA